MPFTDILFEADQQGWKFLFCNSTNKKKLAEWMQRVFGRFNYTGLPEGNLQYLRDSVFLGIEVLYKEVYKFFQNSPIGVIVELVGDHPSWSTISQKRVLHGLLFHHLWRRGGKAIYSSLQICKEEKRTFPGLQFPVYSFYPCVLDASYTQGYLIERHVLSGFKCLQYVQGTLIQGDKKEEEILHFNSNDLDSNIICEGRVSRDTFIEDLKYQSEWKKTLKDYKQNSKVFPAEYTTSDKINDGEIFKPLDHISMEKPLTLFDYPRRNIEIQSNFGFFAQGMSFCSLYCLSPDLAHNIYRLIRLEPIVIATSLGYWIPTDVINLIIQYIFDLSLYTPPVFD